MPLSKQAKIKITDDLKEGIKRATSIVFVSFNKLTVGDVGAVRKAMRGEGISYKAVKKTLLKRALECSNYEGNIPELEGQVALAYGEADSIAPARLIKKFSNEYKDSIRIIGGVFEGAYRNASQMQEIASIPTREALLSQIAYLLNSPIQRLAIAVDQIAKSRN